LLLLQSFTLLREMLAAFGQLGQADRASLVGVQQTFVGACGPVQPGAQLLLGGLLPGGAGTGTGGGGEAVELRQELVRVGQQGHDMVPHDRLDFFGVDMAAGADAGSRHHDAILAVASVDLPHRLSRRRRAGDAIHGQPAGLADEQAAQQVAMPGVVAERECCVARELGLRLVPCPLVDQRRHRNGDPLLARLEATPGRGDRAWTTLDGRLGRRHVGVAVGIGVAARNHRTSCSQTEQISARIR